MQNLTAGRKGEFRKDVIISKESETKSKIARFEVFYLKSMNGAKGVRVTISKKDIEIHPDLGFTSESFMMFNDANVSGWARQLARKNDKAVAEVAELLDPHVPAIMEAYLTDPAQGKQLLHEAIMGIQGGAQ